MPTSDSTTGRLAPSPTGQLHLGHARSFLLAYWFARSLGGRVVLRMEDVDAQRSSLGHVRLAEEDLRWLGLGWDGPVVVQSDHLARTLDVAQDLVERGLAYPCVCQRRDLRGASGDEVQGAPQQGSSELRYPGTCRGRFRSIEQAERATGRAAGLRLITRDEPTAFADGLFGPQSFNVQREVGDFLIVRRDKTPAYQLAVVVSDVLDGVNQVVRGSDLLPSTARQLLIYRALGQTPPQYAHVSLVCDEQGNRLAKRAGSLGLSMLRERGVEPEAIVAWAARTCGQRLPEGRALLADDVLRFFDPRLVGTTDVLVSASGWAG